jgi:hypothetical protein
MQCLFFDGLSADEKRYLAVDNYSWQYRSLEAETQEPTSMSERDYVPYEKSDLSTA